MLDFFDKGLVSRVHEVQEMDILLSNLTLGLGKIFRTPRSPMQQDL